MEHKFVTILVEGQTEESFVKEVLYPYLEKYRIWVTPVIIYSKNDNTFGKKHKGGSVSFGKANNNLKKLLQDTSKVVTTFFDFYRLPNDFPEHSNLPTSDKHIYERVIFLERAFENEINNSRFKAYIQPHEFEALLFSDIVGFTKTFSEEVKSLSKIQKIIYTLEPEEINNGVDTAPSKRIEKLFKKYKKVIHGKDIATEIGIEKMLEKCPHFREWIDWMKNL